MKVIVIGGGPAGLYFAYLLKRENAANEVRVYEQNPRDATFGFGVVFSDRALEFLRDDDEDTHNHLKPHMESWPDLKIVHRDRHIPVDGNGFAAIGRLALLNLLQDRALDAGVDIEFERPIGTLDAFGDADLIVGSDGVNSLVRRTHSGAFRASEGELSNHFIWYGTTSIFDCLTLTFRSNEDGVFCAHHYRYSPTMSTFLLECDEATWQRTGFGHLGDAETRAYFETVFAPELDGRPLVSNKSSWRKFPLIWNNTWASGRMVLVGDALRTAHFSIGSGTRLAMEDAIALNNALRDEPRDIPAALFRYQEIRRPPVEKIVNAANVSARWYERMAETMQLPPYEFAHAYMMRTGRMNDDKLMRIAPNFMKAYLSGKSA